MNSKSMRSKLVRVLFSKIETMKQKQLKKRQLKMKRKQARNAVNPENPKELQREVIIRLKPFT